LKPDVSKIDQDPCTEKPYFFKTADVQLAMRSAWNFCNSPRLCTILFHTQTCANSSAYGQAMNDSRQELNWKVQSPSCKWLERRKCLERIPEPFEHETAPRAPSACEDKPHTLAPSKPLQLQTARTYLLGST
jgi:hypothetical protein